MGRLCRSWTGDWSSLLAGITAASDAQVHGIAAGRAAGHTVLQGSVDAGLALIQIEVIQATADQLQGSSLLAVRGIQGCETPLVALPLLGHQLNVEDTVVVALGIADHTFQQILSGFQGIAAMRPALVAVLPTLRAVCLQVIAATSLGHSSVAVENGHTTLAIVIQALSQGS